MVELLIVVVIGLLAISAAATLGPRLGFAAPLLLVAAGIGASLLPFVPEVHIEPGGSCPESCRRSCTRRRSPCRR
jgi:monovalent cation/hydrogen antiporter